MNANKHDSESEESKPRDHDHPSQHVCQANRNWRIWLAVLLMFALVGVYVMTNNLSWRPGQRPTQPMPVANAR
jgi:fucose permease